MLLVTPKEMLELIRVAGGHSTSQVFSQEKTEKEGEWGKGEKEGRQARTESILLLSDACRGLP